MPETVAKPGRHAAQVSYGKTVNSIYEERMNDIVCNGNRDMPYSLLAFEPLLAQNFLILNSPIPLSTS